MAYVIMDFGKKGRTTTRLGWMDDLHRAATFMKRCSSRGSFFLLSPFVSVGVLTTFFFFLLFTLMLFLCFDYRIIIKDLEFLCYFYFSFIIAPFTPLTFFSP